jgi:hypothetical protein
MYRTNLDFIAHGQEKIAMPSDTYSVSRPFRNRLG